MPTKNINTNTNINKININIPKPRQPRQVKPKTKTIEEAEKELKDLENKDAQYTQSPNIQLSINPNVYGFNRTPLENRVIDTSINPNPTLSIEEQQARQAQEQENQRQAREQLQREEEFAREQQESQTEEDNLFRGENMDRGGLGAVRQSYFQTRGNDFTRRMNEQIPIAQAYPSEYESESDRGTLSIASRMRNTPMGRTGVALQQKFLDEYATSQQESRREERKSRRGRKAGSTNRPKEEIELEKYQ